MKLQDFSNELRKDPAFVIAELQLKLEEANARIAELEADNKRIKMQLADCECALDELTDPYFDIGVFLVTGKVKTAHYILTYGLTLGKEPIGLLIKKDFTK